MSEHTARLQQENQRMEERLRILRQVMAVEKVQREMAGGPHWPSSQREPLASTNRKSSPSRKEKQTNLKKSKLTKVRVLTDDDRNKRERGVGKPSCGQCDQYSASMECLECVENYCMVCFTKMHQKGGLSKHHVRLLSQGMMKETCQSNNVKNKRKILADAGTGFCGQESVEEGTVMGVVSKDSSTGETSKGEQPAGENLLEGQYDEIASAASFQQALIEWRAGQKVNGNEEAADVVPTSSNVSCTSCGVQATPNEGKVFSEIKFTVKSGRQGSYMEQMMLKRKHQDQNFISRAFQPLSSPHSGQNPTVSDRSSSEDEADTASNPLPSIYNVFYTSEDRGDMGLEPIMGVDTFFDTHHLSQVNIEELHELTAVPVVAIATHKTGTGGSQHAQKGDQLSTSLPKGGSKRKKDILRVDKEKICEPSAAVATIKEEYAHPREGRKEVLPVQNEGTRVQKKAETVAHPKARRPKGKKKVIKMPQRLTTTTTPLVEKQVPSVVPGIEESVKQAWSSKQQSFSHDLSSFFCSSDSHGQAGKREDPVAKESDSGQGLPVSILLPLTLPTSWVPGSSVSGNHSDNDQAQTESSLLHISHSDLPPPSTPTSTPTLDHDSADDSDNRSDGRLSPYITEDELEEAKEWAAADGCTLEKLAGELASTTTRDNYEKELEEDMGREVWSRMTTEQLAQEFEEYQNKVMDEDDFD